MENKQNTEEQLIHFNLQTLQSNIESSVRIGAQRKEVALTESFFSLPSFDAQLQQVCALPFSSPRLQCLDFHFVVQMH